MALTVPTKQGASTFFQKVVKKFTTRDGLIGDYDYMHLFMPKIPFITHNTREQPFFGLDSEMPIVLGMILGFQHSLSMLAGIITPPIIISSAAHLSSADSQYLVSASLLVSGILSSIQITRFHIYGTKYYIGTGLLSVVGTSFATITIVNGAFPMMYANGECPVAADGTKLACPQGYGAILGTGACCALLEIALSFIPPKALQKIFPSIVTGPVVLLIGVKLIQSGVTNWLGGSNCTDYCPYEGAPMAGHFGNARFFGLGFLVYFTILLCEKWGSPIMKSCAVIMGLLVGCIVAAACGYFSPDDIEAAPAATFIWVHTFKLSVYGPAVLPMLATYIVLMMEAIGDITATCDVSRLEVEGDLYDSRIQGGVLADGFNGVLACLCTITPVSTFAQNNGVISITKCANRTVGYWCCFFLIVMGIFSKFAAALTSIPNPVLGGMTTFLFTSVSVAGLAIISRNEFTRRDRFVLTATLVFGFGSTMVKGWFSYIFTYTGSNNALKGFFNAIVLVMETGYAIAGILGVFLNLVFPQEEVDVKYIEAEEEINETGSASSQSKTTHYEERKGDEVM